MQQRQDIATHIYNRLVKDKDQLRQDYLSSKDGIGYFYIDNLLHESLAQQLYNVFPEPEDMMHKKSIRERKHVAAQMNSYDRSLEETLYAFQDERIVKIVGEICGIPHLEPDEHLYAGGLSLMAKDNFLNPHLDNSHDKDRNQWRVLNLLYYVTPDWQDNYGGHLEIWPNGLKEKQITIHSRFNRLAVMATHQESWHSVSPVTYNGKRSCISNYYFSQDPLRESDRFHVTSFRGRPSEGFKDFILTLDSKLRMGLRKIFKKGVTKNPHVYKKPDHDN